MKLFGLYFVAFLLKYLAILKELEKDPFREYLLI